MRDRVREEGDGARRAAGRKSAKRRGKKDRCVLSVYTRLSSACRLLCHLSVIT